MSRPPNEDDGDAGSARARTAAPGDRAARDARGDRGRDRGARRGRHGRLQACVDGEAGRATSVEEGIPGEDSTAREVPAPSNGLAAGLDRSLHLRGAYRRSSRGRHRARRVERPSRGPRGGDPAVDSSRARVKPRGETPLAGRRKRASRPTAGAGSRASRGVVGRATRDDSGRRRSPRGYLRTFRARLGRPGWVRRVCRGLGHGSTAPMALSPAAGTISSLGVMSCHRWRAWRFGSIS